MNISESVSARPCRLRRLSKDGHGRNSVVSVLFLLFGILLSNPEAFGQVLPNGVAAGDVTSDSVVLWARTSVQGTVRFQISDDPAALGNQAATFNVEVTDPVIPAKVDIVNLVPNTRYYYTATDADGNHDCGEFVTCAVGERIGLRFGVSGDWRGDLAPYPSIRNIPQKRLDLFISLGDTAYCDVPSPVVPIPQARTLAEFRAKHNEVYSERVGLNTLAAARASTAILAVIDDHEVTNDFAGAAHPSSDSRFDNTGEFINETEFFGNGLQAFHEYNPIRDEVYEGTNDARTEGKRKLYRQRTYGLDAAFFLLDARSFRDEPLANVGPTSSDADINKFLEDSFDSTRTMLGRPQVDELKADLLKANSAGVTWKFVIVPEPIQNLSPAQAADRFEGYAAERTEILKFIEDNEIRNVVFIAADIHGTVINNLTYQNEFGGEQIETRTFEVTTGSVAYAAPFGPTVIEFVDPGTFGPIADAFLFLYELSDRRGQDGLVTLAGDFLLQQYGNDPIGLNGSPINAILLDGGYVAVNSFGWTEFEIDEITQDLTVTTWGIDWYSPDEVTIAPTQITNRQPEVVSRFVVRPDDGNCQPIQIGLFAVPNLCGCGLGFAVSMILMTLIASPRFRRR